MSKINKLGKSTFVIAILSFLLVAVLAFGGTYAYFSAQSDTVTGNVVTGHLRITNIGEWDAENSEIGGASLTSTSTVVKPGQVIYENTKVTTEVTSNISYFTRVRFDINVTPKAGHTHFTHEWDPDGDGAETAKTAAECGDYLDEDSRAEILNIAIENGGLSGQAGTEWQTATQWAEGAKIDYSGNEVVFYKLKETVVADVVSTKTHNEDFTFTIDVNKWVGDNGQASHFDAEGCEFWMDATIEVTIIVEVIQSEFLTMGTVTFDTATVDPDADETGDEYTVHSFMNGADAKTVWDASLAVQKNA